MDKREIENLSSQAQATFLKWKDGVAVRDSMWPKQKRTFQRHKKEILEVLGVDINETVREQMAALERVRYHGDYLLKRDQSVGQGFLPGLLRPA